MNLNHNNNIDGRIEFCCPGTQYQQTATDKLYVQVQSSLPLSLQLLSDIGIFAGQVHGTIGENLPYKVSMSSSPQHPTDNAKIKIGSLDIGIHVNEHEVVVQKVTLESHQDFLKHQVKKMIKQNNNAAVLDDPVMLYLSAQTAQADKKETAFSFDSPDLKTFSFMSCPKPVTDRLLCWRGCHTQPIVPIYISERVLTEFQIKAVQYHPNEIGAQLGGVLGKDKDTKFVKITDIEFFNTVGNEVELTLPATESIRIAGILQQKNLQIMGWVHSHGFGRNALYCSSTDIHNNYERNTNPFAVMLIADSMQLSGRAEPVTCSQCLGKRWCRFKPDDEATMKPGWSAFGWTINGSIASIPLLVYKEEEE